MPYKPERKCKYDSGGVSESVLWLKVLWLWATNENCGEWVKNTLLKGSWIFPKRVDLGITALLCT